MTTEGEGSPNGTGLKSWREGLGWSLARAADHFGFVGTNPAETYRRYESGQVWPKADVLQRLIEGTDGVVTADALLATRISFTADKDAAE